MIKDDMIKDECGSCKFCKETDNTFDDEDGSCFRYPPQIIVLSSGGTSGGATYWPDVNKDDWCGEFKPKETL